MLKKILDCLVIMKNEYMQSNDIFDHIDELVVMTMKELEEHGIVGKMSKSQDNESDPTLYHCQHEIGKLNQYPYCPYCGKSIS